MPRVFTNVYSWQQERLIEGVIYKIASNRQERERAFRLVYEAYRKRGLIEENAFRQHVTQWHLMRTTVLFIAVHNCEVICTMTLICDDSLHVPMNSIYSHELNRLRESGVRFAEVSCLATRKGRLSQLKMFHVFVQLVGMMFQYARNNDLKQLVIAIHPRHVPFYQRFLGFSQIGGVKAYRAVRDNPAVACAHEFNRLDVQGYKLSDQVYSTRFDRRQLLHTPISRDERENFAQLVARDSLPVLADAG